MPAIRVAGVEIIPSNRARSSFRLGSSASALIPSAFSVWVPSAPPTTTNFSLVLANSTAVFATATGSVDHASAIGPFSSDLRPSKGSLPERDWSAGSSRLCRSPPRLASCAADRRLGDRETRIAGDNDHRRGAQRLIELGDELALLRTIHVSSPFDPPFPHLAGRRARLPKGHPACTESRFACPGTTKDSRENPRKPGIPISRARTFGPLPSPSQPEHWTQEKDVRSRTGSGKTSPCAPRG